MANSKLLPLSLLALLAFGSLSVVSAGPIIDFINALQPGATQNQDMTILKPVPDSLKKKIPDDVKSAMHNIKVSDLKTELKAGMSALKNCINSMESPKQCIQDIKNAMPKLMALANAIKPHVVNMKNKLYNKIQQIIPQLNSQLLKNMLQTVLNILPMPAARRRKRSVTALEGGNGLMRRKRQTVNISIKIQVKSMQQQPMPLQQIKSLLKQIKQTIIQALSGGGSSPSLLQQIVNLLSSLNPMIAKIFSNPSVMSFLGTQAPPSS